MEIKHHASLHTDFYRGLDKDDNFPIINKSIIKDNFEAFKAYAGFEGPIHTSSTSGSTGIPFSVLQDMPKRKRTIADLKVFGEMAEYPSHECMIFFRALSNAHLRSKEQEERENIFYIDSFDLGNDGLERMYAAIIEKKPRCLMSYSSTLVELARYISVNHIDEKFDSLVSVITIGEGLSQENKLFLEKLFNCRVYRRYSDMELGIMAQDCNDGNGYKLNWGSFYFECVKLDKDEPADYGEVGRIVVTDLFNYAFPLIRYDTGDLGIMTKFEDGVPILSDIYGRVRDIVYTVDGSMIAPAKITVSMWGIKGVKQWQFIQKDENEYVIKLNCSDTVDIDTIIHIFKGILGDTANIIPEYVDEIPCLASTKRRAVICEYHKNGDV